MKRTARIHRHIMRDQAAGEIRAIEEAGYARRIRTAAWPFPSDAKLFDIIVWPAPEPRKLSVYVTVGSDQHQRIMPNTRRTWRELTSMATRAAYGLTDHTGAAR